MALLQASEPPPPAGQVTVGEFECRFLARDVEDETDWPNLTVVPDIQLDPVTSLPDESRDPSVHFLPVSEHWMKRFFNTWRDRGLFSALEGVASNPDMDGGRVGLMASWLVEGKKTTDSVVDRILGRDEKMTAEEMVCKMTQRRGWANWPVRAMDIHPRLPYIALAREDDSIEIRELIRMESETVLRDMEQRLVSCLKWAPHSNSLLAVGSKIGVLLWNIDLNQSASRFLTSWVRIEISPGHVPVTTISWSPCANYLVSGSPADVNLVVWDVPMGVATRVRRTEGGGVGLVGVSPLGGRVFAGSVGGVMRVWETERWTCEKWTNATESRCQAAVWSPDGHFLLFALAGDPALYYLCFHDNDSIGSAVKCAEMTPCAHRVGSGSEPTVVGGAIQSMCWDQTGQRLAITFTEDSPGGELVAVLRTKITTMVEILPGGFVRGREGEVPHLIEFQKNCRHDGALLATAWSSGRVSFTPLYFTNNPSSSSSYLPHPPPHSSSSFSTTSTFPLHHSQLYSAHLQDD